MKRLTILFSMFMLILLSTISYSQSLYELTELYNKGTKLYQEQKYKEAVDTLTIALKMADGLDQSADEVATVKKNAPAIVADANLKYATTIYKENILESIRIAEMARDQFQAIANTDGVAKAKDLLSKLYYGVGKNAQGAKDNAKAIENYNKSLEYNPDYALIYLRLALIYKDTDDEPEFKKNIDLAIEKAGTTSDDKVKEDAIKVAKNFYYNKGILAKKATKYSDSEKLLLTALGYDANFDEALALISSVYNELNNWDEAIKYATKAAEVNTEAASQKAKIYFELGRAYQGKGDVANACSSYKKAMYGSYAKSAEYQRVHILKCTD